MQYLKPIPKRYPCDYCGRLVGPTCWQNDEDFEIEGQIFHFCNVSVCYDGFLEKAMGRGIIIVPDNPGYGNDPLRVNKYMEFRRDEKERLRRYVEDYAEKKASFVIDNSY